MKKILKFLCCALPLLGLLCVVFLLHVQEPHDASSSEEGSSSGALGHVDFVVEVED